MTIFSKVEKKTFRKHKKTLTASNSRELLGQTSGKKIRGVPEVILSQVTLDRDVNQIL